MLRVKSGSRRRAQRRRMIQASGLGARMPRRKQPPPKPPERPSISGILELLALLDIVMVLIDMVLIDIHQR